VLVDNVARRFKADGDCDRSWSVLVEGAESASLIQLFNDKSVSLQLGTIVARLNTDKLQDAPLDTQAIR
jgi:hypothetical protein